MATINGFTSGPTSSGRLTWYAATLDCGHNWYSKNAWEPITDKRAGETVECKECADNAASVAWLEALNPAEVFRARFRMVVGRPTYHLYRRDPESPSGVMLIRGVPAIPAVDAILRRKGISPLSPTEDLGGAHGPIGGAHV